MKARPTAVFSFGGQLNTSSYLRLKGMIGEMPFNWLNSTEIHLRNPAEFAASIKTPLYCFVGEDYADNDEFSLMEKSAGRLGKPFIGYIVLCADYFDYFCAWTAIRATTSMARIPRLHSRFRSLHYTRIRI